MREKRNPEKRLPDSAYEVWLKSQHTSTGPGRHKVPSADSYETWVEKRVEKKGKPSKTR